MSAGLLDVDLPVTGLGRPVVQAWSGSVAAATQAATRWTRAPSVRDAARRAVGYSGRVWADGAFSCEASAPAPLLCGLDS